MTARTVHRLIAVFAFALFPLMAGAQTADKVARIGYLSPAAGPTDQTQAFLQGLRELGYVEGQNLVVEYRWAAGRNERLAELASDLVHAKVDLIVTFGIFTTLAAKQAPRRSRSSSPPRTPSRRESLPAWPARGGT
jgi:putative ABC transport system substrate-binding protein